MNGHLLDFVFPPDSLDLSILTSPRVFGGEWEEVVLDFLKVIRLNCRRLSSRCGLVRIDVLKVSGLLKSADYGKIWGSVCVCVSGSVWSRARAEDRMTSSRPICLNDRSPVWKGREPLPPGAKRHFQLQPKHTVSHPHTHTHTHTHTLIPVAYATV